MNRTNQHIGRFGAVLMALGILVYFVVDSLY